MQAYGEAMKERFDFMQEVLAAYMEECGISQCFFEDFGVRKIGHKRLFERWFRQCNLVCTMQRAITASG